MAERIEEFLNTCPAGLSLLEVGQRRQAGLGNDASQSPPKSRRKIISEHILTPFNLLNFILFLVIVYVSLDQPNYLVNGLFFGVAIINTVSGTFQELRARKEVLRLSLLSQPRVFVIREARKTKIPSTDLVIGDLIELYAENQIIVDARLIDGMNLKVDESLLTGESDPVFKKNGDRLLSGSYVVAGRGLAIVEQTGQETYAASLTTEARKVRKPDSEMKLALDKVSKVLGIAIIVVGIAMLISKLFILKSNNWNETLVSTVAALVGMIPEGLVLLNSVAFVVGVLRLSQNNILVQRMNTIETLARVDVLCLDKTGTITSGKMRVTDIQAINNYEITTATKKIMAQALIGLNDQNATAKAILEYVSFDLDLTNKYEIDEFYSFSSDKKWSGVHFKNHGTWIFGANELLFSPQQKELYGDLVQKKAKKGLRVITVATTQEKLSNLEKLPQDLECVCLIEIEDELRPNAKETFDYFAKQNVEIKIISGDNPQTVQSIAYKAGITHFESVIDMSSLGEDIDYAEITDQYQLFGRVTPFQKKELLLALQKKGHTVAMIGDGVNDIPALKAADCSIAMAQGSDAARVSADLVLLENDLSEIIPAVYEGRRIINNIERVAILFLTKTIYMSLLAFFFIFIPERFPLFPIQMTLIGSGTIGIPGFFLSFMPNKDPVKGNFLGKISLVTLPAGIAATISVVLHQAGMKLFNFPQRYNGTISLILLLTISMFVLWRACQPFNKYTMGIWLFSFVIILGVFTLLPNLFFLARLNVRAIIYLVFFILITLILAKALDFLIGKNLKKYFDRAL